MRKYDNKQKYLKNLKNQNDRLKAENLLLSAKCDYFEDIIQAQTDAMKNIVSFLKFKWQHHKVRKMLRRINER